MPLRSSRAAGRSTATLSVVEDVAGRCSLTLGTETAAQAALCLLDLKLSRLARDPRHADSLLDLIGYASCCRKLRTNLLQLLKLLKLLKLRQTKRLRLLKLC